MSGPGHPGKRPTLCRYFVNSGNCAYGEDCQFVHQNPSLQNPYQNGPPPMESPGMGELGGGGDQYFNATFNPAPGAGMNDFPPFRRGRPRSALGQLSQNAKPFVPSGGPLDQALANDFAALNLAAAAANIVKGGGDYTGGQQPSMPHSSSTPSFAALAGMFNQPPPPTTTPVSHVVNNGGLPFQAGLSPTHSPGISPTSSPHMFRRDPNSSPVPPHRQTTIPQKPGPPAVHQENVGGTTYFYNPEDFTPQNEGGSLPDFTLYHSMPHHIRHMKLKAPLQTFFMADEIKMELLNAQAVAGAHIDPAAHPDIPQEVDNYDSLVPLERSLPPNSQSKSIMGYQSTCYKATNKTDGTLCCLRRIHNFRLNPNLNARLMGLVETWNKLFHPNIVQLRETFTTKAFGDSSIVFSFEYFPNAITLMAKHFNNPQSLNGFTNDFSGGARPFSSKGPSSRNSPSLLSESLIWSYIVQLSSALRCIHSSGLAARTIEPSKILVHGKSRLRVNCVGVMDVLSLPNMDQATMMNYIQHWQQEDLVGLGRIVLALACNTAYALRQSSFQQAIELVHSNYSSDLKNLIMYLLPNNQNRPRTVNDIMPMIGARFFTQLDTAQLRCDVLENELSKEVENGRLARLVFKLCCILERPEFNMDPSWSETGDRYMLKLFRDYLFHQVDENGYPWMDVAHIVQSLNKLDAGVSEKVCLTTRDGQSIFVVSYAELKRFFASAFSELLNAGQPSGYT